MWPFKKNEKVETQGSSSSQVESYLSRIEREVTEKFDETLELIEESRRAGATSLDLSNRRLRVLPPEIGNLTNLTELDLEINELEALPPEIGNLTNLTKLHLDDNNLRSLPPEIGSLANLTMLHLDGNELDSLPPAIGNLTNLTMLHLDGNNLRSLPPEIGNLTNLTEVLLGNNQLKALPPEIGNLTNLTELVLHHTELDSLPPEIGNLTNLTMLHLDGNNLRSLPPEIGNLTNLKELVLDDIHLEALPPEIGNLTNLTVLELTRSHLRSLPPEIGNLTNLTWMYLDDSELDALPSEIGNLTSLTVLDLHDNQLKALPPEIGNLTNLTWVVLNGNKLEAQPPEISNLTKLMQLDLGHTPSPSDWSYPSLVSSAHISRIEEFGPFAWVHELRGIEAYSSLGLLNWRAADCQIMLQLVQNAIEASEYPGRFIHRLLTHPDWRLHIIAAVAVLLHDKPREFAQSLWSAIDAGSWVAPQLIVTVFLIDPEFVQQAKRRIELGCPVSAREGLSPDLANRDSPRRSAKNAASLLEMLGYIESESAWVATERSDPAVNQLLESDLDAAGDIANRWLSNVRHEFSQFGVELTPPGGSNR